MGEEIRQNAKNWQLLFANSLRVEKGVVEVLEKTEDDLKRMWLLICIVDGMTEEQIMKLQDLNISKLQSCREIYLKEKYEASDELKNTVKLLKKQVADDLKESKAVRESIEVGLEQALKEQTEAQKELIASKDEMIALLRKQLVEAERVGIKKEQENEKRQQELQEIVNRLEQTSQKEQQEAVGVEIQPKLSGNPFQRLFRYWRRSANTKIFIDRYLKNKDYTDGQKEYLLQCLEQGMELKEIERFASANLSTDMMKRLQKLQET